MSNTPDLPPLPEPASFGSWTSCARCAEYPAPIFSAEQTTAYAQAYAAPLLAQLEAARADAEKLREALTVVQTTLVKNNELPRGPIVDTIWYSDCETLFDYIESALTQPEQPKDTK